MAPLIFCIDDDPNKEDVRFYSRENNEPMHVHVLRDSDGGDAKFWLFDDRTIQLDRNLDNTYSKAELKKFELQIVVRFDEIVNLWYEKFNNKNFKKIKK